MATTPRRSSRRGDTPARRLARRAAIVAGVVALLAFAIEGGEYGTRDLLSRTSRRAQLELEVAQLEAVVDSLTREKEAIEKDPATLERIAREEFGMVKGDREILYRFADDGDDADADSLRE